MEFEKNSPSEHQTIQWKHLEIVFLIYCLNFCKSADVSLARCLQPHAKTEALAGQSKLLGGAKKKNKTRVNSQRAELAFD